MERILSGITWQSVIEIVLDLSDHIFKPPIPLYIKIQNSWGFRCIKTADRQEVKEAKECSGGKDDGC